MYQATLVLNKKLAFRQGGCLGGFDIAYLFFGYLCFIIPPPMKKIFAFTSGCLILLSSCGYREVSHARLIEFRTDGVYNSYTGYAKRYSVYVNSIRKGNLWHIYDKQGDFSIWARDTTLLKTQYDYPAFNASMVVTPTGGPTKLYTATSGQFRMIGLMEADITGDFHFKVKNNGNANDSLMLTQGYFRIYLEFADTVLAK
jgi:hypothetical protein